MSEKRCGDCKYFVAFRNYNYETCTNDTITEYCELLQNKATYDRNKGDEIWNDVFDDCPLKTGYVSTKSAILLLQSKKEVRKQFDNYVGISCEKKKKLQDENEQLKKRNKFLEEFDGRAKTVVNLKEENEQLKNKLNVTALELVDEAISMGKAVEISEMNYHEFLEYRQKKGKPMELQR